MKKKLSCKFDRTEKRKNEWFTASQSHEDTEKYQCVVPEKCHWKIHWIIVNRKISLFEIHVIIEHENKIVIIKAANSSRVFFLFSTKLKIARWSNRISFLRNRAVTSRASLFFKYCCVLPVESLTKVEWNWQ